MPIGFGDQQHVSSNYQTNIPQETTVKKKELPPLPQPKTAAEVNKLSHAFTDQVPSQVESKYSFGALMGKIKEMPENLKALGDKILSFCSKLFNVGSPTPKTRAEVKEELTATQNELKELSKDQKKLGDKIAKIDMEIGSIRNKISEMKKEVEQMKLNAVQEINQGIINSLSKQIEYSNEIIKHLENQLPNVESQRLGLYKERSQLYEKTTVLNEKINYQTEKFIGKTVCPKELRTAYDNIAHSKREMIKEGKSEDEATQWAESEYKRVDSMVDDIHSTLQRHNDNIETLHKSLEMTSQRPLFMGEDIYADQRDALQTEIKAAEQQRDAEIAQMSKAMVKSTL